MFSFKSSTGYHFLWKFQFCENVLEATSIPVIPEIVSNFFAVYNLVPTGFSAA